MSTLKVNRASAPLIRQHREQKATAPLSSERQGPNHLKGATSGCLFRRALRSTFGLSFSGLDERFYLLQATISDPFGLMMIQVERCKRRYFRDRSHPNVGDLIARNQVEGSQAGQFCYLQQADVSNRPTPRNVEKSKLLQCG